MVNSENESDDRMTIIKLHKKFSYLSLDKFKKLLQDARYWKNHLSDILN